MVAPKAETIFDFGARRPGAIVLHCPECSFGPPLRCETTADYPAGKAPKLVRDAGPLGFIVRCDACGFRVKMHGDRLPTTHQMARSEGGDDA